MNYEFYQFSHDEVAGYLKLSSRLSTETKLYVYSFVAQVCVGNRGIRKLQYSKAYPAEVSQATFLADVEGYACSKFDKTLSDTLSRAIVAYLLSQRSEQVGYTRYTLAGKNIASVTFDADVDFMATLRSLLPGHIGLHAATQEEVAALPYIGELAKVKQVESLLAFGTETLTWARAA